VALGQATVLALAGRSRGVLVVKLLTVLGARPQFIKASVVSARLSATPDVAEVLVHTGQHFDDNMSDVFFSELGLPAPAHELGIHGGGHGDMTGRMLSALERVLLDERPDAVIVYGDTNSTLAGALAAVKLHIPVAHIEAGLRSFNMRMPEEVNRILTDRVSRWLFAPTDAAAAHLLGEGTPADRVTQVGDVMYDVALHHGQRVGAGGGVIDALGLQASRFALATVHRAENTDDPARLERVVAGLAAVANSLRVVWPVHPRTRAALGRGGLLERLGPGVTLIDPQGYLDMVRLERAAAVIVTDSGGVQKEAFFHRVPCVTLRDETEWVELVDAGWNRLVPLRAGVDVAAAVLGAVGSRGAEVLPYGSGDAARRIVERLVGDLST
jgi:UDP-GlcNAc3NAcA epimerase